MSASPYLILSLLLAFCFSLAAYLEPREQERAGRRARSDHVLEKWQAQEANKPEPDLFSYAQIVAHLADLEEREGRLAPCIDYLERLQKVSPHPDVIQKQLEERKLKLARPSR